jgi:hypothetical protein
MTCAGQVMNRRLMLNNMGQCLFMIGLFFLTPWGIGGLTVDGRYTVILLTGVMSMMVGLYLSYFSANQIRR